MTTKLYSFEARQKIGLPNQCGEAICGWSLCGDENIFAGIYQGGRNTKRRIIKRYAFYDYVITHSAQQNVNRSKFASAVSAWQILSAEIKAEYKHRAISRHMSGYNLFIKEFMKL